MNTAYQNLWDFIAEYLPNYSDSEDVMEHDILTRYIDGEDISDRDKAWIEEQYADRNAVKIAIVAIELDLIERAVKAYHEEN